MDYDKSTFPEPPGFDEQRQPIKPHITRGRMGLLGMVIGLGLVLAIVASVGPGALDHLRGIMPAGSRNAILDRIQIFLIRGDVDRALKECDRLVELDAKDGHFWKAAIYAEFHRYEESADEYSKLIEIEPANAAFYNNRAYHRALARIDLSDAMKDIEHALQLAPDVPAYVDTRGYLYYLNGQYKEALADFNKVLDNAKIVDQLHDRAPELGEIYFHRGLVHKQMRDVDKAEHDFELAHRLGFRSEERPDPVNPPQPERNEEVPVKAEPGSQV